MGGVTRLMVRQMASPTVAWNVGGCRVLCDSRLVPQVPLAPHWRLGRSFTVADNTAPRQSTLRIPARLSLTSNGVSYTHIDLGQWW